MEQARFQHTTIAGGKTYRSTEVVEASAILPFEETIEGGADPTIPVALPENGIAAIHLECPIDIDVILEDSESNPLLTIELRDGVPYEWTPATKPALELGADVAAMTVDNSGNAETAAVLSGFVLFEMYEPS